MAEWKYNIGDHINDGRRNLTITGRKIRYLSQQKKPCHQKWVKYTCNICGWTEGWISEKSLTEGKGCSCCSGRVIVKGINDAATRAPHIIPYLVNPDDANLYTPSCQRLVKTKCPFCGATREYRMAQLTSAPYVCYRCGKRNSIPERFFHEFLTMYNIEFIPQLSSAKMRWCGKYRYDFFIPSINAIIELHGRQHFQRGIYNRTFMEIKNIDKKKKRLALSNGIKNYCVIPFVRSEKNEMIETLINHEVIDLLGIQRENLIANLEKCYERILGNRMIDICEYYNSHPDLSAVNIGKRLGISSPTVLKALHDGTDLGLCSYDGQKRLRETQNRNTAERSMPIEIICPDGEILKFNSIKETYRESKTLFGFQLSRWFIKKYCNNGECVNGYRFRFANEN